jgi:hypothetical protein
MTARRVMAICVAAAACFAASALTASSASAVVTIGSALAGAPNQAYQCDVDNQCTVAITSLDPTLDAPGGADVPSDGVIVRWRIEVGAVTSPVTFRVVRPEVGGLSSGQGASAQVTPPANQTSTFLTRLPVEQDDRIGIDCCQGALLTTFRTVGVGEGTFQAFNPVLGPAPQNTFANISTVETYINADIEADADGDDFGDETQDNCLGSQGPDDGCPEPVTPPPVVTPPVVSPVVTPVTTPAPAAKKKCKKRKGKKTAAPYAKKCKKKKKAKK